MLSVQSAHRGRGRLCSAGAPHLPLPMPRVVLGDDRAAQPVVVRGAAQARLVRGWGRGGVRRGGRVG